MAQTSGGSLRRQAKEAAAYAAKNNFALDNTTYQDHGVSAHRGKNAIDGKLGAFLKAIDKGSIETPCCLIIEALDRISRNDIFEAQDLFESIVKRGITLVVLKGDGQVFSRETMKSPGGLSLLIGAILSLVTANEETANKSKRIKQVFEQHTVRRQQGQITSRYCPSWLTVNESKTKFIHDTKKVKTIRRIFDLSIAGNGVQKIAQILNDEDVEIVGKRVKGGWKGGNVAGILRQPALTGRLIKTGTGEVINPTYYPEIIPLKVWTACQSSITGRNNGGGRGQGISNLFSRLTTCAYCGSNMKFTTGNKGSHYLYCLKSMVHICDGDARMMPYDVLESDVVNYLAENIYKDLKSNVSGSTITSRRKELQQEIIVKQNDVEKWVKAIAKSKTTPDVLLERMDEAQKELDDLQKELAALNTNPRTEREVMDLGQQLMDMFDFLWPVLGRHDHEADDPDFSPEAQREARLKIQVALRRQIKSIEIAPHLDEHPKWWKTFNVKGKPKATLHSVKISYAYDDVKSAIVDIDRK